MFCFSIRKILQSSGFKSIKITENKLNDGMGQLVEANDQLIEQIVYFQFNILIIKLILGQSIG
jgi:hypothetical protein